MAYPKRLLWIDLETTGLPNGNDFSDVHLLEIAVIVTDLSLSPLVGYTEVLALTDGAVAALRSNDYVRNMHMQSGLMADCVSVTKSKEPGHSLVEVQDEIFKILAETKTQEKDFMIAGSGVGTYDFPWLKHWMPKVAEQCAYFPFDIGVLRRTSSILAEGPVVNPTLGSFGDSKVHRAMQDIEAHMQEAKAFKEYFQNRAAS